MKKIKIRIIVPANTDAFNQRMKESVESVIPPDVEIDVANIPKGQPHIQNRSDFTINLNLIRPPIIKIRSWRRAHDERL